MKKQSVLNEQVDRMKILMEGPNMVKLKTTSYPNVKFDNDGTQNDEVNDALLQDIQKAAESVGIVATITTAKTGHPALTINGRPSRHMTGTGVDVAILDGIGSNYATNGSNGNAKFRMLGNKLKDALVSMGYTWNVEIGNDKAVLWQTNTGGNHFNHLHISNKTGASEDTPSKQNTLSDLLSLFGKGGDSSSKIDFKDTFNKILQMIFNKP
jgi:hypothetical protein